MEYLQGVSAYLRFSMQRGEASGIRHEISGIRHEVSFLLHEIPAFS